MSYNSHDNLVYMENLKINVALIAPQIKSKTNAGVD